VAGVPVVEYDYLTAYLDMEDIDYDLLRTIVNLIDILHCNWLIAIARLTR
jgi:hypothetical protein